MHRTSKAGADRREAGYTYVSVLIILMTMAMAAQVSSIPTQSALTRNAEAELIFRGRSYRDAIASYWNTNSELPPSLDVLVSDPDIDGGAHIRQLYADPIGKAPWTLIYGTDGGISGVVSRSTAKPRRTGLFPSDLEHFEDAANYSEWTFIFESY